MPLYEYACGKCGHEFELLVASSGNRDQAACPECGSKKAQRKMSVFAARQAEEPAMPPPGSCGQCGIGGGGCPYGGN